MSQLRIRDECGVGADLRAVAASGDSDPRLRGDARGRDGGFREVMATRVKRVTVVAGRAVHVDHRARLRDPVDGLHNIPRRVIWRFDSHFRGGGQNGTRTVQILRDDGRVDIRRPWHDRHWAGPATAAADPWQGSDGAVRRSRHWIKSKTLPAGKSTTATKAASTGSCAICALKTGQ